MRRSWLKVPTIMTAVLLVGFFAAFPSGWNKQLLLQSESRDLPSQHPTKGKIHVLLLSSWRSGSSFLGQVFSQHPDVFYLMEPGWHVWSRMQSPGARALQVLVRDLLRNVFQCDLTALEAYTPPKHNVSHLFMWDQSRALCSPPACPLTPRNAFSEMSECVRHCNRPGFHKAQEACHSYSHVVLKEVRLFDLEPLYPLLRDPTLDLRIIHLVRDPRAVAKSRDQAAAWLYRDDRLVLEMGNLRSPDTLYRVMQEICLSHERIHRTAMLHPPRFLRGHYRLVRFEDMVRDPIGEVQALYNFTGLRMTPQMKGWIHQVTHGKIKKGPTFHVSSRNAAVVSEAWRTKLPHSKVRHIQDVCKAAMSVLGYQPVNSEQEQKRVDLDLLVARGPFHFNWMA